MRRSRPLPGASYALLERPFDAIAAQTDRRIHRVAALGSVHDSATAIDAGTIRSAPYEQLTLVLDGHS